MRKLVQRHIQPLAERHPAIMAVASATAGMLRNISIKPYRTRTRRRELALRREFDQLPSVLCRIYKEKGAGNNPVVVVGGFVPDATEAMEFQRPLLRNFGSIYYINYPRNGFSAGMFSAQLADLIDDLHSRGRRPVVMGISFGAGLLVDFLRKADEAIHSRIKGLILVSPVLCTQDLVRPDGERSGGVRMLESNLRKILKADPSDPEGLSRQVERARRCFTGLFEAGAENRTLSSRHLSIRRKIFGVIENTSAMGGYQRVLALRDFREPCSGGTVFAGPALVLKAEDEQGILVPSSPGLAFLNDPSRLKGLFPNVSLRTVLSSDPADPVPHASLIFHQHCFNPLLESWLDKIHSELLWAVA
jgi:hypothetical protein